MLCVYLLTLVGLYLISPSTHTIHINCIELHFMHLLQTTMWTATVYDHFGISLEYINLRHCHRLQIVLLRHYTLRIRKLLAQMHHPSFSTQRCCNIEEGMYNIIYLEWCIKINHISRSTYIITMQALYECMRYKSANEWM